jgi:hypothetical protein
MQSPPTTNSRFQFMCPLPSNAVPGCSAPLLAAQPPIEVEEAHFSLSDGVGRENLVTLPDQRIV